MTLFTLTWGGLGIAAVCLTMSRPPVILTDQHPYHITARSNNRDWFDVPMSYCFGIYINVFDECLTRFNIKIHAFVLMNNHFHLILSTPDKNVSAFLKYFMTETSKGIGKKSQRINHIYGGRNHKSLLVSPEYYALCLKYVYRNPVKAGICERVEDYRWSTISKKHNKLSAYLSSPRFGHDSLIGDNKFEYIEWLNKNQNAEVEANIQRASRSPIFKVKEYSLSKKRLDLAGELPTRGVP